jgi:hypothetical protein
MLPLDTRSPVTSFRFPSLMALVGLCFLLAVVQTASAISLSYAVSTFEVPSAPPGSGLSINPAAVPAQFFLDDGDSSAVFNIFTITQDLSGGASFPDTPVSAAISVSNPTGQEAVFNGTLSAAFPGLGCANQLACS